MRNTFRASEDKYKLPNWQIAVICVSVVLLLLLCLVGCAIGCYCYCKRPESTGPTATQTVENTLEQPPPPPARVEKAPTPVAHTARPRSLSHSQRQEDLRLPPEKFKFKGPLTVFQLQRANQVSFDWTTCLREDCRLAPHIGE